jgi:general stress protein 26
VRVRFARTQLVSEPIASGIQTLTIGRSTTDGQEGDAMTTTHDASLTLDDLLEGSFHIAMVMTMIEGNHSSRPVTVLELQDEQLTFMVDITSPWVAAIEAGSAVVHVTVAEQAKNTYVALNGTATLTNSLPEIERLWNPAAGVFFDGKDDPNIRILHFQILDGEYWDGPSGRIGRAVAMLRAALGDNPAAAGTHGDVVGKVG